MQRFCVRQIALLASIAAFVPGAVHAQLQHSPFMTATAAVSSVSGGQFSNDRFLLAQLTLGERLRRNERFDVMLGAFMGSSVGVNHDEVTTCGVSACTGAVALPEGALSDFKYAGVMTGVETRFHSLALTVLAGPEFFHSEAQTAYGSAQAGVFPARYDIAAVSNFGLHTQADASVRLGPHMSLVLTATTRYFPHFRNAVTHMNGLGFGLRIQ